MAEAAFNEAVEDCAQGIGKAQVFIAIMQAARLVVKVLPEKGSSGSRSATVREFHKSIEREKVSLSKAVKSWIEDGGKRSFFTEHASPASPVPQAPPIMTDGLLMGI